MSNSIALFALRAAAASLAAEQQAEGFLAEAEQGLLRLVVEFAWEELSQLLAEVNSDEPLPGVVGQALSTACLKAELQYRVGVGMIFAFACLR